MTRAAFENAITVVIALGGSTNAVLHLMAMKNELLRRRIRAIGMRAVYEGRRGEG